MFFVTYSNLKDEYNAVMASQGELQQIDHGIQEDELEVPVEQDQNHAQTIVSMLPSEAIRNVL